MTLKIKGNYTVAGRTVMTLMILSCLLVFYPLVSLSEATNISNPLSEDRIKMMNGEPVVILSRLNDGVTGVAGKIYISAPPQKVWKVLTDYNHQKYFIPNIIESGLISDNGGEQVVLQRGKSGILFFQMKVSVTLKIRGEYLKYLGFKQIAGDFKVYNGEWNLEDYPQNHGTLLSYKSEVKPDFFAPAFIVRHVQKHVFPSVLSAIKARAELSN